MADQFIKSKKSLNRLFLEFDAFEEILCYGVTSLVAIGAFDCSKQFIFSQKIYFDSRMFH